MKKNYWPLLLLALYSAGFILYFVGGKYRDAGAITLVVAVVSHIVYTFSPFQRSAISMLNARRAVELGNIDRAFQYILKAARLGGYEQHVGYLLSPSKKSASLYRKLAEKIENYAKENGQDDFLNYVAASIYYHIGDLKKAIDLLMSIPKGKQTAETVRLLGTALLETGKVDEAIKTFKTREKKEGPYSKEELAILLGLGLCYAEKKDRRKAEEYYLKVKQYNPDFPEINVLRNKIYPNE